MGYEKVDRDTPLEGEREVWAFGTGPIPKFFLRWSKYKRLADFLKTTDGFVGVHVHDRGTLLLYETENEAIRARNLMKAEGFPVSSIIGKVFIDENRSTKKSD